MTLNAGQTGNGRWNIWITVYYKLLKELCRYIKLLQAIYEQIHVIQNHTHVQTQYYSSQET